jgi:hypothetical protein
VGRAVRIRLTAPMHLLRRRHPPLRQCFLPLPAACTRIATLRYPASAARSQPFQYSSTPERAVTIFEQVHPAAILNRAAGVNWGLWMASKWFNAALFSWIDYHQNRVALVRVGRSTCLLR